MDRLLKFALGGVLNGLRLFPLKAIIQHRLLDPSKLALDDELPSIMHSFSTYRTYRGIWGDYYMEFHFLLTRKI